MINQHIEKLLILQDRDQVVRRLKDQLTTIPLGIKVLEDEIQAERNALEESKSRLQGLEIQRNDLDTRVRSAEEQVKKYKNQQLQVKKNEEFQALVHEIDVVQQKISEWEEAEIGFLLDIDAESEVYSKRESIFDDTVAAIREKISSLEKKMIEVEQQLKEAEASMDESKGQVEAPLFSTFTRLTEGIRMPVVVSIEQQTCKGCHLRVSNDTLEQTRRGEELTTCDNCGRIVYLAS